MFPSFPYGKHCFQCQFLFSRCKLCLQQTTGNFNENPSMRALAKILQARASEHSSNFQLQAIRAKAKFCEHFQIGWDHSIPLCLSFGDQMKTSLSEKFFRHTLRVVSNTTWFPGNVFLQNVVAKYYVMFL